MQRPWNGNTLDVNKAELKRHAVLGVVVLSNKEPEHVSFVE
jgi:hypothetical protein